MITVIQGAAPTTGYKKGTLLQAKRDFQGKRNIYMTLEDSKEGAFNCSMVRLVGNGIAEAPAYTRDILMDSLELFTGKLEISNV